MKGDDIMRYTVLLLMFSLFMYAAPVDNRTENIWIKVGKIYHIDPRLLYSIGKVESDIDRYIVAFTFNKMSPKQAQDLSTFLRQNNIESKQHSQVIAIKSKNKMQAVAVVNYLYNNNYPRFDVGIMQINSIHKPLLDKAGISFADLFDPVVNIQVGAYILSKCFQRHGQHNYKDAINAYNGKLDGNPYSGKVINEFEKLYGSYKPNQKLVFDAPYTLPKR